MEETEDDTNRWKDIMFLAQKNQNCQNEYTNQGKMAHEKMLNNAYYQRNSYQNTNEVSLRIGQKCHHQKVYK